MQTLSDNDIIADKFFAQSQIFDTVKQTVHSLQEKLKTAQNRHEDLLTEYQRLSSDLYSHSESVSIPRSTKRENINSCAPQHDYRLQNIYSWTVEAMGRFNNVKQVPPLKRTLLLRESKLLNEQKPHTVEETANKLEELCKKIIELTNHPNHILT